MAQPGRRHNSDPERAEFALVPTKLAPAAIVRQEISYSLTPTADPTNQAWWAC